MKTSCRIGLWSHHTKNRRRRNDDFGEASGKHLRYFLWNSDFVRCWLRGKPSSNNISRSKKMWNAKLHPFRVRSKYLGLAKRRRRKCKKPRDPAVPDCIIHQHGGGWIRVCVTYCRKKFLTGANTDLVVSYSFHTSWSWLLKTHIICIKIIVWGRVSVRLVSPHLGFVIAGKTVCLKLFFPMSKFIRFM